jgi:cellulose synthase/poly-beta-1,6-N-acetylglucosamine synthase-like glycosyltransferase
MILIVTAGLLLLGFMLLPAVAMLSLECAAALLPERSLPEIPDGQRRPSVAILIPAHNEASGIQETIKTLKPQLHSNDQLLVIADNCSDNTASLSRSLGVTVIERQNLQQRGKGYALDFGRNYLKAAPPEVVMIVDADCAVHEGTIAEAAKLAHHSQSPVQVTNLLAPPAAPSLKDQISSFAFTVRTFVRPNGIARLGLPLTLHGTGMAFPWPIFNQISLANDNLVEDLQLSIDLLMAGHLPQLCRAGRVTGVLPSRSGVAAQQRKRWEHGHLNTLFSQTPKLFKAAWQHKQFKFLAIALDLCVPPLALLVLLWASITALALSWGLLEHHWWPARLLGAEGLLLFVSILLVWFKFSRSQLPLTTLLAVPFYIFWKVPIYLSFLLNPQKSWVRTSRDPN